MSVFAMTLILSHQLVINQYSIYPCHLSNYYETIEFLVSVNMITPQLVQWWPDQSVLSQQSGLRWRVINASLNCLHKLDDFDCII